MELIRVTNQFEMFSAKKVIYPLLEKYYERGKKYLPNVENAEELFQKYTLHIPLHDFYLYLIRDNGEFTGFYAGYLVRIGYKLFLHTFDYYIPGKGVEFGKVLKMAQQALGAEKVVGEAPDKILRVYRRILPDATIETIQMVRIGL